jgi:hypothetical protein
VQTYAQDLLSFVELYQKHHPNPIAEIQAKAEEIDLPFLQQDLDKILASMKIGTIAFAKLSCRYATSHGWMKLILKQSISTKGLTAP